MKKFQTKQAGVLTLADLKTFKGKLIYSIFIIFLLLCVIIALLPALWTISTAFKDPREMISSVKFFPSDMSVNNIITRITVSWKELKIGYPIVNTLVRSLGEVISKILICGLIGYVLSKLKPKGSKTLFVLIVWTMMMPGQIRMVPNFIGWLHFPFALNLGVGINMLDTYWPFWLGSAGDCFAILLFKNSFDGLSNSYVEAAKIDGCTNYGVFFKIMVPLSMPIIIYLSINAASVAWADYMGPLLYLDNHKTVPLILYLAKNNNIKLSTQFMGYVFSSIPPFLIFAIFQRHIIGGINIGGVKG